MDVPAPGASFTDLLDSLGARPTWTTQPGEKTPSTPEGTTVLALRFDNGVVMAGDRRATEGHLVAHRRIRKVYPTDRFSAVAIAGTAGLAIEMVKLFQVELEHYE
jgi:proteasome beta subunit